MNTTIKSIQTIVDFMGWNRMPVNVALDAVNTIVRNNLSTMADCIGEHNSPEDELETLKDMIEMNLCTQDSIWLSLFVDDYLTTNDVEMHKQALALRGEIEQEMFAGTLFKDARREWDI